MNSNYQLLDTGNGRRLEQIGCMRIVRNAKQAFWKPSLSKEIWQKIDAIYDGEKWLGHLSECKAYFGSNSFEISMLDGGQVGIFPEQVKNWQWLQDIAEKQELKILNGFAYTGGSTMFASSAKTEVTHLDASKTSVKTAKENLILSCKSDNRVRFIVDDVLTFMQKEISRGKTYDGFIFDPPAFGRGGKGKTWKLSRDLPKLMEMVYELSGGKPAFLLLSAHDPSMDASDLAAYIRKLSGNNALIEQGDLVIPCKDGRNLINGYFARCIFNSQT